MLTNGCIIFGQKIDPSFSFVLKFLLVHDSYLTEVYVYIFYRRPFQPHMSFTSISNVVAGS